MRTKNQTMMRYTLINPIILGAPLPRRRDLLRGNRRERRLELQDRQRRSHLKIRTRRRRHQNRAVIITNPRLRRVISADRRVTRLQIPQALARISTLQTLAHISTLAHHPDSTHPGHLFHMNFHLPLLSLPALDMNSSFTAPSRNQQKRLHGNQARMFPPSNFDQIHGERAGALHANNLQGAKPLVQDQRQSRLVSPVSHLDSLKARSNHSQTRKNQIYQSQKPQDNHRETA